MIKSLKTLGVKRPLFLIFVFLIATDLAILLNIPFLRQILGFFFLTLLPGLLILQILKLKIDFLEKFILAWGLSISFLMFFGLLLNYSLFNLGYETPLATISLLISFNSASIVFAIIACRTNKDKDFFLPNFNLSTTEKAFLIVPILFPALSIFGMHVMNTTDNNIILMFLLFLIPIYVAFVCLFNHKFPKRVYPVVIFLISISLLLLISLRFNHIIGVDTHMEYYFFLITLSNLHWSILEYSTLDACLAISLLPTIYQSILNMHSEFLFKIIYSLIYSVSPLIIYVISKKYVEEGYAFLASCFFMFQVNFLWTAPNARTNTAILFFALAMMALFSDKIDPLKKRILFIVFMASCMVSHYSTTYIFFFIMLGALVEVEILSKKYTFKNVLSLTMVILFFSLIFFWYSQVTETAFNSGVGFIGNTLSNLNEFFIEESRTGAFVQLGGQELRYPILSRVNLTLTWCTFIFIGIGVLTMIKRYKEMIAISNVKVKKPDFLKTKFEMVYLAIGVMCAGLSVIMVALPYISVGYDIQRLYSLVIVILSVCFVMGGMTLSKHFFFFTKRKPVLKEKQKSLIKNFSLKKKALSKKQKEGGKDEMRKGKGNRKSVDGKNALQDRAYLIILLILIPYCMLTTGAIYQLFGDSSSIILNSEGKTYDMYYVYDQESYSAKWFGNYAEQQKIYTPDRGRFVLRSSGMIPSNLIDYTSFFEHKKINGYIYLRYYNIVNNKLISETGEVFNMTDYSDMFIGKNKIYANGGSEVYV